MKPRFFLVLFLAAACAAAGCRMADGPMPTPTAEDANRLDDLRRDLGDVVGGNAEGRQNFADDLMVFVDADQKPDAVAAVNELARQVADAASAAQLKEANTPPLLRQVWTAVAARELSEKQVTQLQADVKTTLTGLGVAEPSAQSIANQVGTVQKAVTSRQRRWYEVF
jgi:hypothetical protein